MSCLFIVAINRDILFIQFPSLFHLTRDAFCIYAELWNAFDLLPAHMMCKMFHGFRQIVFFSQENVVFQRPTRNGKKSALLVINKTATNVIQFLRRKLEISVNGSKLTVLTRSLPQTDGGLRQIAGGASYQIKLTVKLELLSKLGSPEFHPQFRHGVRRVRPSTILHSFFHVYLQY